MGLFVSELNYGLQLALFLFNFLRKLYMQEVCKIKTEIPLLVLIRSNYKMLIRLSSLTTITERRSAQIRLTINSSIKVLLDMKVQII
jgi:hypothetical protein